MTDTIYIHKLKQTQADIHYNGLCKKKAIGAWKEYITITVKKKVCTTFENNYWYYKIRFPIIHCLILFFLLF